MKNIALRIKGLMHDKGIKSIYDFSQKTGISAPTLTRIINQGAMPRHETLTKICDFFDISVEDLNVGSRNCNNITKLTNVAEILQFLMNNRHYGQRELERETGISQKTIYRILNGKTKKPSVDILQKIALFFGITANQLSGKAPLPKRYNLKITTKKKPIPLIEWRSLTLLPEILLSESSARLLSNFHGKGIFATKLPQVESAKSESAVEEIIILDYYTKIRPKNLYLVLTSEGLLTGPIVDHDCSFYLLDSNERHIELKNNEYKILGEILETVQSGVPSEVRRSEKSSESFSVLQKIEFPKLTKKNNNSKISVTLDIRLLDYIIYEGIKLFAGKIDERVLIDHCYDIYNSISRITATFEEKEELINLSLKSLSAAIPKKDVSLNKAS